MDDPGLVYDELLQDTGRLRNRSDVLDHIMNDLIRNIERTSYRLKTGQYYEDIDDTRPKGNPKDVITNFNHILNMNRKRTDYAYFCKLVTNLKNRPFTYLMKGRVARNIYEIKEYYNTLANRSASVAVTITTARWLDMFEEHEIAGMLHYLLTFFAIEDYLLFPDIDNNQNRHWHGVIIFEDNIEKCKLKRYFTNTFGFIKYDYINDIQGWYCYMRKDTGFTSREHPTPLRHPIYRDIDIEQLYLTK